MNSRFAEPIKLAVITTRAVMHGGAAILLVNHDTEGDWQFLTGGEFSPSDAMLVGLGEILKHDESLDELFDLPLGFEAIREAHGRPWRRRPG